MPDGRLGPRLMSRIATLHPNASFPQAHLLLVAADRYASTFEKTRDQFHNELAQVVVVLHV